MPLCLVHALRMSAGREARGEWVEAARGLQSAGDGQAVPGHGASAA